MYLGTETWTGLITIDTNASNKHGVTPLMLACKKGHKDVVKMLFQKWNICNEMCFSLVFCY